MPSLLGLDPAGYAPSPLHAPDRTFRETNCYVDLWIELLHARGIDAASAMAFTCAVDFEGDQWTFFKPPAEDIEQLFGIDTHEMQLYRPLPEHIAEQLEAGRTMTIEADAFYMPDRSATSYRREHVKSSIAIEAIEPAEQRLRYFHGPGYFELTGEDYAGVFRLGRPLSDDVLPPYAEIVRFDAGPTLKNRDLRYAAREILGRHLGRKPKRNPWLAFGKRLQEDLPLLLSGKNSHYHAYAFATVRQCGAAFELAKSFIEWLTDAPNAHAGAAAEVLGRQADGAKALLMKLARRRVFDPEPAIQHLAGDWEMAMNTLDGLAFGARRGAA
jgi:Domain of unknown function (DUF1839)